MELFDTQALLCLVSITDHLKSYTWQSTTVTQWGEGNRLDYIKRPCLKGKKKEAKLIVLRLSKQAGISFVKEWIVRWDVTLPRKRIPSLYTPTSPSSHADQSYPKCTGPEVEAEGPLWSLVTGRGLWRRDHRGHATPWDWGQPGSAALLSVWSWLNKPFFRVITSLKNCLKTHLVYRMLQWGK